MNKSTYQTCSRFLEKSLKNKTGLQGKLEEKYDKLEIKVSFETPTGLELGHISYRYTSGEWWFISCSGFLINYICDDVKRDTVKELNDIVDTLT